MTPRFDENSFVNGLLAALGKGATVIFIGHSLGADQALRTWPAANAGRSVP